MYSQISNDYTKNYFRSNVSGQYERIKSYLRIKPNCNSNKVKFCSINVDCGSLSIGNPTDTRISHKFQFDKIFEPDTSNHTIYCEEIDSVIDKFLDGYNCCIFAYGQTGAGKTHTLTGLCHEDDGLVNYALSKLFNTATCENMQLLLSVFEIYCDEIEDLIHPKGKSQFQGSRNRFQKPFMARNNIYNIREKVDSTIFVENLSEHRVTSLFEADSCLRNALYNRKMASTKQNIHSSRSHTIIQVKLQDSEVCPRNTLTFIDLAGSERLKKTHSEGKRLREALFINLSLTVLGKVVCSLASGFSGYVPYRESKLTRILQSSLGGNAFTIVVGMIDLNVQNYEETLSTLHFLTRCRSINNRPTIIGVKKVLAMENRVESLKNEISRLKDIISKLKSKISGLRQNSQVSPLKSLSETNSYFLGQVADFDKNRHSRNRIKKGTALETVLCQNLLLKRRIKKLEESLTEEKEKNSKSSNGAHMTNYFANSNTKPVANKAHSYCTEDQLVKCKENSYSNKKEANKVEEKNKSQMVALQTIQKKSYFIAKPCKCDALLKKQRQEIRTLKLKLSEESRIKLQRKVIDAIKDENKQKKVAGELIVLKEKVRNFLSALELVEKTTLKFKIRSGHEKVRVLFPQKLKVLQRELCKLSLGK